MGLYKYLNIILYNPLYNYNYPKIVEVPSKIMGSPEKNPWDSLASAWIQGDALTKITNHDGF